MMQPSNMIVPPDDKTPVKLILVLKDGIQKEFDDFILIGGRVYNEAEASYATQLAMHVPRESRTKIAAFLSSLAMMTTHFLRYAGNGPDGPISQSDTRSAE